MPVTIDELNTKYKAEDANWDFKLFWGWLGKQGFSSAIITVALKQVLADHTLYTLPEQHHDFDNQVRSVAKDIKQKSDEILTAALETSMQENMKKYEGDWNALKPLEKIWEVIRGRA